MQLKKQYREHSLHAIPKESLDARNHGRNVYQIKESILLKPLDDVAEYARVLDLRLECYRDAGKTAPDMQAKEMAMESDFVDSVYVLYSGRRVVGTVKIAFPSASDILESVDKKMGYYPSSLPPKSEVIEVSCLCIKRGYRHTNILKLVFEQVHRSLVESGRKYILISADERLQKKYRFIGFKRTGFQYQKPNSKFSDLEVMISRQKVFGTYGLHADPIRWNMFLRSITEKLRDEGKIKHNLIQRTIFDFYSCFSWLALQLESYLVAKRAK